MRFIVHAPAMNDDGPMLNMLDAILARVENGVHVMEIPDADMLEDSVWYRTSRQDRTKMLEEIARASVHRHANRQGPHQRQVPITDAAGAEYARNIAYAPLVILVENEFSDGALVEAAIKVFATPATVDLCYGAASKLEPPAFRIENGGGCGELPKHLRKNLAEAKARGRIPRIVVVADSDGEWVGDVKDHVKNIRAECAAHGIPCPQLGKRTAENYIPDAAWRAWVRFADRAGLRPAVEAMLELTQDQRDYVRIGGSKENPWNRNVPLSAALFVNVASQAEKLLFGAELKGNGTAMAIYALSDYPATFSKKDVISRDHNGDLQTLVHQIEGEL